METRIHTNESLLIEKKNNKKFGETNLEIVSFLFV